VIGNYVFYDCHVGVDASGKPTLDYSGYDLAFCPEGSQPGYYFDEKQWGLVGMICVEADFKKS
jgi:hypothetical protein